MSGVDNLRRLDEKLRTGLSSATRLRSRLGVLHPATVADELDQVLTFLQREVAPRARAEEAVFYPEVARMLGVDLSARMLAEHRDINRLLEGLRELRRETVAGSAIPAELYRELSALIDLVRAHLRLEDEALQGMIDAGLADADAYVLYERMEIASFEEAAAFAGASLAAAS
jgi:iron-sulfur cluster repair protein YtfE (RIC family)